MMQFKQGFKIAVHVIVFFVVLVLFVYIMGGLFTSVDFDAGVCRGGFNKYLVDTELNEIEEVLNVELSEEQTQELIANFMFAGRNIYTHFTDENGNTVYVAGEKIWYSEYKWEKK